MRWEVGQSGEWRVAGEKCQLESATADAECPLSAIHLAKAGGSCASTKKRMDQAATRTEWSR